MEKDQATEKTALREEYKRLMRRIEEKIHSVYGYVTKTEADRREELEKLLELTEKGVPQ